MHSTCTGVSATDFGNLCVHKVRLFELFRRRSFEIEDR